MYCYKLLRFHANLVIGIIKYTVYFQWKKKPMRISKLDYVAD